MGDVLTIPEPKFPTPEARTMWLFDTDAAVRSHAAYNFWLSETGLRNTLRQAAAWKRMKPTVREEWERKAREALVAYHKSGPASRRLQNRNALMEATND